MKATVLLEAPLAKVGVPDAVLQEMRAFRADLARRSAIIWAEHCSECAFPACYSQCAFYTPRADLDCRRFEKGVEAVAGALDLGLMRIQFRRWGKLEGQGSLAMSPPEDVAARERRDQRTAEWLAAPWAPRALARTLVWRWNARKRLASQQALLPGDPEAFAVETYVAGRQAYGLTLTIASQAKSGDQLFQARFDARPGYSRALFAISDIRRIVDLSQPFLVQIEPIGEPPPEPIVFGLADFVAARANTALCPYPSTPAPAKKTKTAKCVVFDLDDTLWRGTLAEDGVEGLTLKPEAVELIKALDARGILLSVASKNDPEPALAALKAFGLRDYFLFPQIGWGPKSESVRRIAELIDIGLDTFVFLDDQAFERGEVTNAAPGVTAMDAALMPGLIDHPLFDVPATAESARRRGMYQTEETRQAVFQSSGADYLDFLRSCAIELRIDRLAPDNLERIYELTQRTNQLNFSGARYDRAALSALMATPERAFVLSCADKFGDYGIIGFVVVEPKLALVESFFMSCRVQRKRVEHAFFAYLTEAWGRPQRLCVRFRPTDKNAASIRLLESLGFAPAHDGYERAGEASIAEADIVRVVTTARLEETP